MEETQAAGWAGSKWKTHGGTWSVRGDIESFDRETRSIYRSPQEPSYVCWVVAWRESWERSKVSFVEVTGSPSLSPTMHFNDPHLSCYIKTLVTEDGGQSWQDTGWKEELDNLDGNSDHHWRSVVVKEDGGLIRMMPRCIPGVTDPEGRRYTYEPSAAEAPHPFVCRSPYEIAPKFPAYWESGDGGRIWKEVSLLRDRTAGWWCTDMIGLDTGRLLTIGMVYGVQGKDAYYKNARIAVSESDDDGRTWTSPQPLDLPVDIFGDIGWTEESGIVELSSNRVLAVCRITGPGTRVLAVLARDGDRWEVEDHWVSELPYGGHPFTLTGSSGAIFYAGHDGVWSTVDRGRRWTKQYDCGAYYPQLVEARPGRIISVGHVGMGDTPWPASQESTIQAAEFSCRPIEIYEQIAAGAGPCLSIRSDSVSEGFHLRVQMCLAERSGVAFRIKDDPEDGYYVFVARLLNGPGRWPEGKTIDPGPLVLEIVKMRAKRPETLFKRYAGECAPGTWMELQLRMTGSEMLGAVLLPDGRSPQYIAARDDEFPRGRVGLFCHLSPVSFRNFTLWSDVRMIRDNWSGSVDRTHEEAVSGTRD